MTALADDTRHFLAFAEKFDVLRQALASSPLLDIEPVSIAQSGPIAPGATILKVNPERIADAHAALAALEPAMNCVIVRNVLQYLPERRRFLAACFDKLAIGGVLIVVTPHQFLYERKRQLPSRRERRHVRFYTPDVLLAEIEEAFDPCDYRLRLMADNDHGYDYGLALETPATGGQHIVLCLEKITRPQWRDAIEADESWTSDRPVSQHFVPLKPDDPRRLRVIAPDPQGVDRILVLKLDHRGDFIMADAAFALLCGEFPHSALTLVCGPWNVAEAQKLGMFDEIIPFAFFPEDDSARTLTPSHRARLKAFEEIAPKDYDLVIDLRLSDDTRDLVRLARARHRAGFDRFDQFPWLTIKLNAASPTLDHRAEEHVFKPRRAWAPWRLPALSKAASAGENVLAAIAPGTIQPGRYRMTAIFDPPSAPFEVTYVATAKGRTRPVATGVLRVGAADDPAFALAVQEKLENFEVKFHGVEASQRVRLRALRMRREPFFGGLHQREAMALLVKLAALRLRNPSVDSSS